MSTITSIKYSNYPSNRIPFFRSSGKTNYYALICILIGICIASSNLTFGQSSDPSKSTKDLDFLLGTWNIERTYGPDSDEPRKLFGTLQCDNSLDGQFIKCTYDMKRPGKIRGLDEVYFNYNGIYDKYESLWLSSTWPIKVLMSGELIQQEDGKRLNTASEFLIQNNVTEFVKGSLLVDSKKTFNRDTYIRTSRDAADQWKYHMNEKATRLSD